jgi:kumamolisin
MPTKHVPLARSAHQHPAGHQKLEKAPDSERITASLILRRRKDSEPMKDLSYFNSTPASTRRQVTHKEFAGTYGADIAELLAVASFAHSSGLKVVESDAARRSVVISGTAVQMNNAFGIQLHYYNSPLGHYHGHEGPANLPSDIADFVEAIIGLDNRPIPAKHYLADPPNTKSITPQEVALLYNFPTGSGSGQTIGIYEMVTGDGKPGYAAQDIAATMAAFGGNLTPPTPTAVAIDGETNTGVTDGETLLDITVSSTIAQGAKLAVYFTVGTNQGIINALQRMIHPGDGDPQPNVLSISYGWSPDNTTDFIGDPEYTQMSSLFQDAAHLGITVMVSSGDTGAMILSKTKAEASYPATDPWVTACGGTTIGNIEGNNFTEYIWNDSFGNGQHGASGGGVSAAFPVPAYQTGFSIPNSLTTKNPGRGIPDIAGNASVNSGYPQSQSGQEGSTGGTSAVAPLYAGLIAVINANLGTPVGFINPILYSLANSAFRPIAGPPGPANNSFGEVTGYPATKGWNACTGLGSVIGTALEDGLAAAFKTNPQMAESNHS